MFPLRLRCAVRRAGYALLLGLLALCSAADAAAARLEVRQTSWGFDGRVVPERINLLRLEVVNTGEGPFEGALVLHKGTVAGRLGAELIRPCYLGPGESRIVQFDVYVGNMTEDWTLRWRRGSYSLPQPGLGVPAAVYLTEGGRRPHRPSSVKTFPFEHFPPTVAATDGLGAVVLDHVPRWDQARRAAFLDWVRAGGRVYLLPDATGRYPTFSGELSVLNDEREEFRLMGGTVARRGRSEDDTQALMAELKAAGAAPELNDEHWYEWSTDDEAIFHALQSNVRADHNWGHIFWLLGAYVVAVCPVSYLFARRWKDYRLVLASYVVFLLVFAGALSYVGKRGYGESTSVYSIAYARPLGEKQYAVTQWTHLFVVNSGNYLVTHGGPANVYSTCTSTESVEGVIAATSDAPGGALAVRIPLFSHRSVLHRGRLTGPELRPRVLEWSGDDEIERLLIDMAPLTAEEVLGVWITHGEETYMVRVTADGVASLDADMGRVIEEEGSSFRSRFDGRPYGHGGAMEGEAPQTIARAIARHLVYRALGGRREAEYVLPERRLPQDCVQMFILTASPEGFRIQGGRFPQQTGYTLYHFDIARPEATDG